MTPIQMGVLLAVSAATAFGLTIPLVGWAGSEVGPLSTAALLYSGASLASLAQRAFSRDAGAPLTRRTMPALVLMSIAGAAVAPTAFAWGLQRTGPVTGGLLLNLEAVWTVVFARLVYREHLGPRVLVALALMTVGGVLLSTSGQGAAGWSLAGAGAVLLATIAWAADNTIARRLAESRPLTVVAAKGALGASLTFGLALLLDEPSFPLWRASVLLLAGATGYGVSLRLYLLAQRRIGAARTASVFALAPFIGATLGLVFVPTQLGWSQLFAAALFVAGVALHASERHHHQHRHEPMRHEHPHRHDDEHHQHSHDEPVEGEHSHSHSHDGLEHAHEHADDVHHGHSH